MRCRLPSAVRGRFASCSRPVSRLASQVRNASAHTSSGSRPDSRAARAVAHNRSGESPRCARRVAFFSGPEAAARSTTSIEWAIATSTRALPKPRLAPACAIRAAATACATRGRVRGAFGSDHSLHQKCITGLLACSPRNLRMSGLPEASFSPSAPSLAIRTYFLLARTGYRTLR